MSSDVTGSTLKTTLARIRSPRGLDQVLNQLPGLERCAKCASPLHPTNLAALVSVARSDEQQEFVCGFCSACNDSDDALRSAAIALRGVAEMVDAPKELQRDNPQH